ncbi:hypothetical protein HVTV-2_gp154 [Haloarcula virus HVTV-2]|uniref:Uncharacterized protein n=1 Tax=Haloarcula vallismortis tailed virus 1 TaxID=1262528 RepID=L7TI50_9CAUD|nr:hypothetical protein HVTV1_152 [Haloarcula vallismortis tailed virus 1]AGC34521.1 hypothetical protein HVTV1_152 [Haloarcula vallismortis tailed virus 1]UBF22961.1 hypothetical protein HVTV-2_gp154 [Haloarcula virus HVTV-2]
MTDAKEVAFDALREMYEEAEPPPDFDDALENPDDYDAEWYLDHELPHERQEEIVDEHLEKHNLSKHQETQVTMTAILHYGPSTPDDE